MKSWTDGAGVAVLLWAAGVSTGLFGGLARADTPPSSPWGQAVTPADGLRPGGAISPTVFTLAEFSCAVTGQTSWSYVITNIGSQTLPSGLSQVSVCFVQGNCGGIGGVIVPALAPKQQYSMPTNMPVSGARPTCTAANLPASPPPPPPPPPPSGSPQLTGTVSIAQSGGWSYIFQNTSGAALPSGVTQMTLCGKPTGGQYACLLEGGYFLNALASRQSQNISAAPVYATTTEPTCTAGNLTPQQAP